MALIEAVVLMAFVFGFFAYLGYARVFIWEYGWRNFLTGAVSLWLGQLAVGAYLHEKLWRLALLPFLLWMGIFGAVQMASAGGWALDVVQMNRYFLVVLAFTLLLVLMTECAQNKGWAWLKALTVCIAWLLSLNAFVYLGYYCIFGTNFTTADMTTILLTNTAEAREFFIVNIGWNAVWILAGLLLYAFVLGRLIPIGGGTAEKRHSEKYFGIILRALLIIAAVLVLKRWALGVFPTENYCVARNYLETSERIKTFHARNVEQLRLTVTKEETLAGELPGTVILVIGESANREHMKAFNPAYPSETTPWLSGKKTSGNFFLFPKAYSNFSLTWQSLSMFLTSRNQYNEKPEEAAVSLVDVANLAGYKTYYFTNQDELKNATISVMTGSAEHAEEMRPAAGDDKRLLESLKGLSYGENNLIIFHLEGSHARYEARVPEGYAGIKTSGVDDKVNLYDSTLLYTDEVLKEIFEYARENLNLRAMVYASDHGEDMKFSHNGSQVTFDMLRAPFWVYLSPEYQAKHPETAAQLKAHEQSVFTNDLVFDVMCGILRAPNTEYDAKYDISQADYGVSADNAVTMHGKWKVADDPALKSE